MILNCTRCQTPFERDVRGVNRNLKRGSKPFCSQLCRNAGNDTSVQLTCKRCGKNVRRKLCDTIRNSNHFCSRSCSATYTNTHKKTGTRRSKLEAYLETVLTSKYPNLVILFNDVSVIKAELDIYIPSLKLAFELNGIFHYEPIFGNEKLHQTQNNDNRKFQACAERSISLCVIDTSQQKYFKESTSQRYLDIITTLINAELPNFAAI